MTVPLDELNMEDYGYFIKIKLLVWALKLTRTQRYGSCRIGWGHLVQYFISMLYQLAIKFVIVKVP